MERGFPADKIEEGPLHFFIFAVTIVVVAIPEGLPLAVTISLAYRCALLCCPCSSTCAGQHHLACLQLPACITLDRTSWRVWAVVLLSHCSLAVRSVHTLITMHGSHERSALMHSLS